MTAGRGRLLAVGAITLVAGLALMFPARVAYQWFAPRDAVLNGVGGTVWSGRAAQASLSGVYLRDLSWQIRPLSLLSGKVAMAVEATPAAGFVESTVVFSPGGTIEFENLQGSVPLQSFEELAGMPGLRGSASVQFERLSFRDGLPVAADGVLTVSSLVAPTIFRDAIGGYRAEFSTQASGIVASVEDTDGVVDLAGSFQVRQDRTYQFIAQLAPKANTPERLGQQMRFLGTPNERGQYQLRLEGRL